MSIVNVKKIERGINWGAKDQKTSKLLPMYDQCVDKLVPGIDRVSGTLKTGLTEKDEERLESALGFEKGTLAKSSSYWDSFTIKVPQDGLSLNIDNPHQELQYLVLKDDPTVAESLTALKTNARAEYVMTTDEAEAKVNNIERSVLVKAYSKFGRLSATEVADALYMYGKDASTMSPEVAMDRLGDYLDKDPNKFMRIVGDKLFADKVFIMKGIREGVIRKHGTGTGTNMPLYFEDIMLGNGLEEAIAFIKDKENQAIALGLKKTIGK